MDDAVERRLQWWVLPALWLVGVAVFLPLLGNGFIGDDYTALSIYEAYKTKPFLETILFGGNDFFRPLNMALIMTRGAVFGGNPLPYVIANILLHLVIATLVYFTAQRVTRKQLASTAAAFLFLVSFSHYEGITWISSSVELFAVFFILLSLYAHVRFRESAQGGWLALSLAGMVLAFLTKETSAALPFLILAYDLVMVKREERTKGFFWPYLGYGLGFALYLLVQTGWAAKFIGGDSPYRLDWHILTNVFDYWVWLIMPNPRHPYVTGVLGSLPPPLLIAYWVFAGAAALTLPLTTVLAFLRKLPRPLLWSFCAVIISLVVFLPFTIKISARYAYLPSIGFALLAGGLFAWVWEYLKTRGRRVSGAPEERRGSGAIRSPRMTCNGDDFGAHTENSYGAKRMARRAAWQWVIGICGGLYLLGNAAGLLLIEREFVKTSALTKKLADEVSRAADFAEQDVIFIDDLPAHVHLHEAVDWLTSKDLVVLASNDAYRGTPKTLSETEAMYYGKNITLYHLVYKDGNLKLVSRRQMSALPE